MKTFFKIASITAVAFTAATMVSGTQVFAQGASQSQTVASAQVTVIVPDGGKAVTYKVEGKEFTVEAGQSRVLPANAVQVSLPEGTIVKTEVVKSDGSVNRAQLNIVSDVLLPTLSKGVVKVNMSVDKCQITEVQSNNADGTSYSYSVDDPSADLPVIVTLTVDEEGNTTKTTYNYKEKTVVVIMTNKQGERIQIDEEDQDTGTGTALASASDPAFDVLTDSLNAVQQTGEGNDAQTAATDG